MTCPYCGTTIPKNSKVCPNCEYERFKEANKKRRKNQYKEKRNNKRKDIYE